MMTTDQGGVDITDTTESGAWEIVDNNKHKDRLRIPGGWLYRTILWSLHAEPIPAVALVFVPREISRDSIPGTFPTRRNA